MEEEEEEEKEEEEGEVNFYCRQRLINFGLKRHVLSLLKHSCRT
jgi:hypothetical protein